MRIRKLWIVALLAAAWGCAGKDDVNIGDNTRRAKTGDLLSDYAASWDGYTEAYTFHSGSDRLRIELDDEGHGTVVLGDGVAPAPATDPNDWYSPFGIPPGQEYATPDGTLGEGFAYTVQQAEVQDKRLRFAIDAYEVYKSWCELQVPIRDTSGDPEAQEYDCVPYHRGSMGDADGRCFVTTSTNRETTDWTEVSCPTLTYCGPYNPCSCTADGCTVAPLQSGNGAWPFDTGNPVYVLDAALDDGGDSLVGTMTLSGRVTVRMERH